MMYVGRLLGGFAGGIVCACIPPYLAEISEPSIRGRLGTAFHLCGCIGALLINVVAIWLTWRWLGVFLCLFPSLTVVTMLAFGLESPTDLLARSMKLRLKGYLQFAVKQL
jgi:SP family facilitated glucose transporter-like MFS transporter 8